MVLDFSFLLVLATVVTLGTRRQDVTALQSLAPVELITPEQITRTGAVTLNQALTHQEVFETSQKAMASMKISALAMRKSGTTNCISASVIANTNY